MIIRFLYLLALILPACGTLYAQNKTWIGTTDEWGLDENWSPNGIPESVNSVIISSGAAAWPKLSEPVEVNSFTMNPGSQIDVKGHKLTSKGAVNLTGATVYSSETGPAVIETKGGASYLRNSVFANGLDFTATSNATVNEADDTGPNTYNGNVKITMAGSGALNFSTGYRSVVNGNLTIERPATAASGTANVFTSGAVASTGVTGDFTYINKIDGATTIGGGLSGKTVIAGKVNIDVETTGNFAFTLQRLANTTSGGVISIKNPGTFSLFNDTLTVASFTVSGKKFSDSNIINNKLTFNTFQYEDDPLNNAVLYVSSNEFNGAATFTQKGTAGLNEGWAGPNTYNGNTVFTAIGGTVTISGWSKSTFNGNLTVERTATGTTNVFTSGNEGSVVVTGNFFYKNHADGETRIGAASGGKNVVNGKVDIDVETTGNPAFTLRRLANYTTGGAISIVNPGALNIQNDTLTVTSFTVSGKKFTDSNINNNELTFDTFGYEDDPLNNATLFLSSNEFNGVATFTSRGSGPLNESWNGPNQFNGNVTYSRNGAGNIVIGHSFVSSYAVNLTFASTAGIVVNAPGRIRFNGAMDGTFTQTGVAEPVLPGFVLEKTGDAKLVLIQPLRTSNTVSFVSGCIEASETSPLIFQAGTGHTGAGDESHVIGPVHKIGNTGFTFPVGSGEKLFTAGISAPSGPTDRFSAEFFARNPGDDGYDPGIKAGTLTKVYGEGYWEIQPVAPTTGNVTITLGYNFPSGYITDPLKLAVAHWSGGLWNDLGNGDRSGNNTVGTVSTAGAVPAFSPFTIASTEDINPLPVVLAAFSVFGEETTAILHWTTTDEVNSERFEIEHSTDARIWNMVGVVAAKKERNIVSNYTYIHTNPFTGINYYRLKMADPDGSYIYSKIESLVLSGETVSILYPNPVSDRVFIKAGGKVQQVEVIDLLGRTVQSIAGDLNAGLDISRLVPGLYRVRLSLHGGSVMTHSLAIAR